MAAIVAMASDAADLDGGRIPALRARPHHFQLEHFAVNGLDGQSLHFKSQCFYFSD